MFLGSCLSCRCSTLPQFAVWQTREAWTKSDAVYSGTKGAIISFSKTPAREMARHKITVNVVCPGPTMTPLGSNLALEYAIMPVWPLFLVLRSQCHSREFEAVIRVGRAISCNSSDRANDRTVTLMFQGDELSRAC
jgi:NAD(P)-dependent dehydrogenase (short-subunit alcohol dehydrogenase family)